MVEALVERLDFAFNIESTDTIILDGIVQCQSIENSGHALRAQEVVERAQSRVVRLLTLLLLLNLLLTEDALGQPVVIIRIRIGSGGDVRKANGTNRQFPERHARPPKQDASADAKTRPVQRVLDFQIRVLIFAICVSAHLVLASRSSSVRSSTFWMYRALA